MTASVCGSRYWGVRTALSEDGIAYIYADAARVDEAGTLILYGSIARGGWMPAGGVIVTTFAAGFWAACFLADKETGAACAAAHWPDLAPSSQVS